ncbi:MAG: RNA polymerase sigma factor [Myxococcales bacterium]|nr:RNA polymerase sigma factor [Myxococcales bacterium]
MVALALQRVFSERVLVYRRPVAVAEVDTLEALMARVQAGERAAFEQLYARLGGRVLGFLRAMARDPQLAEDLTQTTFLKVFRARETWRRGAPVEPWVFAIARHAWLDHLRRTRRRPERVTDDGRVPEASDDALGAEGFDRLDADSLAALERGIAALPEAHREALLLLKVEGLSVHEAAAVAGVSPGNLKVRAHRAYEALRKVLKRGGAS